MYTVNERFKLRISQNKKNEQIKTAQKIHMNKKLCRTTNLCVEIMNSSKAKGKLGHVVQIRICRLT